MNTPDNSYEFIAQYLPNVKYLLQNLTIELGQSPLTPLDKGGTGFPPLLSRVFSFSKFKRKKEQNFYLY